MSSNSDVRAAWKTNVFDNFAGINAYNYAIDADSGKDVDKGYSAGKVNFFSYIVSSQESAERLCGKNILRFKVEITRVIQDDTVGTTYNTLIDDFRTVNDYVLDNLGNSWGSTVDLVTLYPKPNDIKPTIIQWDGKPCWNATVNYEAEKIVNN